MNESRAHALLTLAAEDMRKAESDAVAVSVAADPGSARDAVLVGPPSSGKTEAILRTILETPIVRPGIHPCDVNVFVVHYAALPDACKRAKTLGVRNLFCVSKPSDFKRLVPRMCTMATICVICRDATFNRLCDHLHTVTVQRLVFDNVESLRIKNYPAVRCNFKWFLTADLGATALAPALAPAPRKNSRIRKEAAAAYRGDRVVKIRHVPPQTVLDRVVVYRETAPRHLNATICALYGREEYRLAEACLPCANVRACDMNLVYSKQTCDRVRDPCTICFEEKPHVARIVAPCCENNFCAECFLKHILDNPTCPMCRSNVDIHTCISVSDVAIQRLGSIVQETKKTLEECLADPRARVLVVSGRDIFNSVADLMWYTELAFVDICGNNHLLDKRIREFASSQCRLGVVRHHQIGLGPIRIPGVTHIVFVGYFSDEERAHWSTRGVGPHTEYMPKTLSMESVYNRTFNVYDEFRIY
eukprot:jgi/Tetstr1/447225/TSEL_034662.t1